MLVRFWGTRGSLAKPGPGTVRYGGNTSCVEVRGGDGTLIVLDCGTGAHGLGQALLAGPKPCNGHLLIGHTHWDHIQGFPFFAPLFVAGNVWDIYAPGALGRALERTLSGQMEHTYFPVTLAQLGATIRYHDIAECEFAIGPVRVTAQYLNHPALTLGYRMEEAGNAVVYAVDHEPHAANPAARGAGDPARHGEDQRHIDFLAGADLVIHDTQYTIAEYPQKTGWGHTPAEWAVDYAMAAGARRLALTHHDPLRDDAGVDRVLEICRRRAEGSGLEVFAAAEGQEIRFAAKAAAAPRAAARRPEPAAVSGRPTILVADDDADILRLIETTLESDGYRVVSARDGESALRLARLERPALVLLDWEMPGADGVEVTRCLRQSADPALRDVAVVLITGRSGAENTAEGFAAGVTDYLTKPFRPAHLKARVQAWLQRRPGGDP